MQWGIVDVRAWLKTLPKGTLKQWEAFDAVEPIGEQWRQTAEITTMLSRLIEYTVALKTGKQLDPASIEDNMPPRYVREPKPAVKKVKADPRTEFEQVAASLGLSKIVKKYGRVDQSS